MEEEILGILSSQGLKEEEDEISLVLLCWPDTVTTPNHERLVCLPV